MPGTVVTLAEASRAAQNQVFGGAILNTVNRDPLLLGPRSTGQANANISPGLGNPTALPFMMLNRPTYQFLRESTRGSAVWFTANDTLTTDAAVTTSVTASVYSIHYDFEIPNTLQAFYGADFDFGAFQAQSGLRSIVDAVMDQFYYGVNSSNARLPDGVHTNIDSNSVIERGTGGAGQALRMQDIDNMMTDIMLMGVDLIVMPSAVYRLFLTARRSTTVSGTINFVPNDLGGQTLFLAETPVAVSDYLVTTEAVTSTTYSAKTGGATSSMFFFKFGEDTFHGIAMSSEEGIAGLNLKMVSPELEDKNSSRWRYLWNLNPVVRLSRYGVGAITGIDQTTAITA